MSSCVSMNKHSAVAARTCSELATVYIYIFKDWYGLLEMDAATTPSASSTRQPALAPVSREVRRPVERLQAWQYSLS
jgi:hypothetical protein